MSFALRDEAVWQFHIGEGRGLILQRPDYSLYYVSFLEAETA
jgi:hypothetical protein